MALSARQWERERGRIHRSLYRRGRDERTDWQMDGRTNGRVCAPHSSSPSPTPPYTFPTFRYPLPDVPVVCRSSSRPTHPDYKMKDWFILTISAGEFNHYILLCIIYYIIYIHHNTYTYYIFAYPSPFQSIYIIMMAI